MYRRALGRMGERSRGLFREEQRYGTVGTFVGLRDTLIAFEDVIAQKSPI